MTWLSSIGVGIIAAFLGGAAACGIANLCVGWYRISGFEGKAGFYVVGVTLLGLVAGFAIGLVAARVVAAGEAATFLRALGYGTGATAALALAILGFARLGADISPTYQGRDLEIEVEVRGAQGFTPPPKPRPDLGRQYARVRLIHGSIQPEGELKVGQARKDADRWVVTSIVPLDTSAANKYLAVHFSKEHDLLFSLPLRPSPDERDFEWSAWIESGWDAGKPQPPPEARFTMRYRVRPVKSSE